MKICPFCGAQLPEEAIYCLNCASVLNERQIFPPVKEKKEKKKKAVILFPRKKLVRIVAIILPILIVTSSCLFAIKSTKNNIPKSEEKKTSLVPVTDENGENITDGNGEQIYEITEITETTTEKKGILDKLFNKNEDKSKDKDTSETTTKKPSLLDKVLGKDKAKDKNSDKNDNNVSNSGATDSSGLDISQKPTSAEKDTINSSEEPSTDNNNVTAPTQSQAPTETEPTAEEEIIQEDPAEVFEFAAYSGNKSHLSITQYKGNAEHVVIPSSYNGQYIVEIQRNAFKDNDKVKIISIDGNRPFFDLRSECFYNCRNLHTINLPGVGLEIVSNFAKYCYAMKTIVIKNNQYKFENGGLYYYNGSIWSLRYFCPAAAPDTFTIPLWCAGIEDACNLSELSQLRVINCHEYVNKFPHQTSLPNNLEAIYVDAKNKNGYDVNGIAFGLRNGKYYCSYPPQNPTKEFTLPNNSYLLAAWLKNPYLETLRIEETAEMLSALNIAGKNTFPNLKTIYIKSGHKDEADIKKFKGTVYTY